MNERIEELFEIINEEFEKMEKIFENLATQEENFLFKEVQKPKKRS